jgi:hypothetical protein
VRPAWVGQRRLLTPFASGDTMIAGEEIEQKAAELSISPINVEKDYVCGWLPKAPSTTKSIHWRHEREIRAAVSLSEAEREGGFYFATVDIRGVVLGAFSQMSAGEIRKALPVGRQVSVTQARLAFGSYNIVRPRDMPVQIVSGTSPTGKA